jgi:hypothetical protein
MSKHSNQPFNMKKNTMTYKLLCEKERLLEIVVDAINGNLDQEDLVALEEITISMNGQWENYKHGMFK